MGLGGGGRREIKKKEKDESVSMSVLFIHFRLLGEMINGTNLLLPLTSSQTGWEKSCFIYHNMAAFSRSIKASEFP